MKTQRVSQDSLVDEVAGVETEEEEMESDMVNCVCGLRETNGLMIQVGNMWFNDTGGK